jgi:hypothetical protein
MLDDTPPDQSRLLDSSFQNLGLALACFGWLIHRQTILSTVGQRRYPDGATLNDPFMYPLKGAVHSIFFKCHLPRGQSIFPLGLHVRKMRSLLHLFLLSSFLALLRAFELPGFLYFFSHENFLDIPFWEEFSDPVDDYRFLLTHDCSDYPYAFGRKRARRSYSPDFCNAVESPTGSAADEGQMNDGGVFGNTDDRTVDPVEQEPRLDEELRLPALSTYSHEKNDECFRLSEGKLPLAVCDLGNSGGSPDYLIGVTPYWNLLYSYPSKKMTDLSLRFPHLLLPAPLPLFLFHLSFAPRSFSFLLFSIHLFSFVFSMYFPSFFCYLPPIISFCVSPLPLSSCVDAS